LSWASGRTLNTQSKTSATKLQSITGATNLYLPSFSTLKLQDVLNLESWNLQHLPFEILKQLHCKYQQIHPC